MAFVCKDLKVYRISIIICLIICISVLNINIPLGEAAGSDSVENTENIAVSTSVVEEKEILQEVKDKQYLTAAITPKGQAPEPQGNETGLGGGMLLYAGVGIAAIAGAAVALSSSGSSSSTEEEDTKPDPTKTPVGATLHGTNWTGKLILADSGTKEPVTATVYQNGSELEITTTTTQKYGKKFVGTINSKAFITVTDQTTGEVWTTHFDKARWNMIDLYDYVHNLEDFDRLYLTRTAKQ